MLPKKLGRFQRELEKRKSLQDVMAPASATRNLLETVGHIAQISLALVAVFGYFYTVQPVYQKDRLAEQVAEYEGVIKKQGPKIAETERQLTELQGEREKLSIELQRQRARLTQELKTIEGQLSDARKQKSKIENQIPYMTFRYVLPDGSPALTPEQVKIAQVLDLRRSFISSLSMSCTFGFGGDVFPSAMQLKRNDNDKLWPFTEKEVIVWKDYGSKYPLKRAIECIDSVVSKFSQRYGKDGFSADVESIGKEAVQYASTAGTKPWTPPLQPDDLFQELKRRRSDIETTLAADLKMVEEQYGGWESAVGADRREILRNNYQVGKQNAKIKALNSESSLGYEIQQKANTLRKSINEEVARMIIRERNKDPK